jgi:hypothetical protein
LLRAADTEGARLLIDGPLTDAGLAALAGLDGVFDPKSACTSSSPANCGLGGTVNTITNPRLLRLAVLRRF